MPKTVSEIDIEIKLLEAMAKRKIRVVKELAEKSGIHVNVLYQLLNGKKSSLRLDTIAKLCKTLDCEIGELIEIKK